MKKILVLGSTGLIGHQVYLNLKYLGEYEVITMAHQRKLNDKTILCDARNEVDFINKILELSPNIIVNCMGILIAEANENPEHAIFLNAYMPHRLKRIANGLNAKLIHISTDCVFSGKKGPYVELDMKDADNIYGRTKAIGEIYDHPHLTLRTSVVGPELKEGEELFHWFMRQNGEIQGYTKAFWSGVTTLELAKIITWAIKNDIRGLYHVTNGKPISKYELLMLFKKYTGKKINIRAVEGRITNKSLIDSRQLIKNSIPDYDVMLEEMVTFMKQHPSLYSHYTL